MYIDIKKDFRSSKNQSTIISQYQQSITDAKTELTIKIVLLLEFIIKIITMCAFCLNALEHT